MAWPVWGTQLVIWGALFALDRLGKFFSRGEDKKPPRPQDFDVSRTAEGTPLPMIYGTCRIDSPILVWHGNADFRGIEGGFAGYTYGIDLLYVVGVPPYSRDNVDATDRTTNTRLRSIWWGDYHFSRGSQPLLHGQVWNMGDHDLFGGQGAGGGLNVNVEFFDGRRDQVITSWPSLTEGSLIDSRMRFAQVDMTRVPGYRHQVLVAIMGTSLPSSLGIGESPDLPQISFEVENNVVGLGLGMPDDQNPAWVIYDLITSPIWKMNYRDVDRDSFVAAAATLEAEKHGYSRVHYQNEEARKIIGDILQQIDGVVFEDPVTGLIKLKLIRTDYNAGTLRVMDVDNTIGRPEVHVSSWSETYNQVEVTFTDRSRGYKQGSARAQKLANITINGNRIRSTTIDLPGVCTAELASKIAARELNALSRPVMSVSARVNRQFFDLMPGDAVKANWPQLGIVNKIFRVAFVDLGQLGDNAIRVSLVEDIFDANTGAFVAPPVVLDIPDVYPITERIFDEAPYWLIRRGFEDGALPNSTSQYVLDLAVASLNAFQLTTETCRPGAVTFLNPRTSDVPRRTFPRAATVAVAYARELEPYDTTTGLVIGNLEGDQAAALVAEAPVGSSEMMWGANLILVGREVMAYTSVTDLGGGQVRLNNVWRGLLDTAPIAHPIGTRVFWLSTAAVGRKAWSEDGFSAVGRDMSHGFLLNSFSADVTLPITGRANRSLRATDLRVEGFDVEGALGIPAVAATAGMLGQFKRVTYLDGALDILARQANRTATSIVRGDDAGYTAEAGTTWTVASQKVGESSVDLATALATPQKAGVLLGASGHGEIDLLMRTLNAGEASWQSPAIRVSAARYRNLLGWPFVEGGLAPFWISTAGFGTVAAQTGANSLGGAASGKWIQAATHNDGTTRFYQRVDVTGYKARGLTALATWYSRNFSGDTDDWSSLTIKALDAADSVISSSASAQIVGPTGTWRRNDLSFVLPSGTVKVEIEVELHGVTNGLSLAGVTGFELRIGEMTGQLLGNPSFTIEAFDSWSNVTNSFVENLTSGYAGGTSTRSAQGGAFATSEIAQTVAVSADYQYGTAILTFARSNAIAGDTGQVVLEALDGTSSLLGTVYTAVETLSVGVWSRRRLALDLPVGTTQLRVRLIANRAAGAGNSGALFDDFALRVHNALDPAFERDFRFGAPTRQPMPATWEAFRHQWPAIPAPAVVFSGDTLVPSARLSAWKSASTQAWSDAPVVHAAGSFVGHLSLAGADLSSVAAHYFRRGGPDIQITDYGAFTPAKSFSVAVCFRTDEPAFGAACGLVGRRDSSGKGWGIRLNPDSTCSVVLQGAAGAASVFGGLAADRSIRWIVMTFNAATSQLGIYDHTGGRTTSTATIGDFAVADIPLRIGRDAPGSDTLPGMIARVLFFDVALTEAEGRAFMLHGADPSGLLDVPAASGAVWVPGPNGDLIRAAATDVPIGYSAALDADGDGYGIVTARTNTNACPSHDFADTTRWAPEAGLADVEVHPGIVDNTGLARGVQVENFETNVGLRLTDIPMTAAASFVTVIYARSGDDPELTRTLDVVLLDGNGVAKGTQSIVLSGAWTRYVVSHTWDNATPNAIVRFKLQELGTFELSHAVWCGAGPDAPFAIQDAGVTLTGGHGVRLETLPLQLNREGEIYVEGIAANASPAVGLALASIDRDLAGNDGKRRIVVDATGGPDRGAQLDVYSGGVANGVDLGGFDWATSWTLRGRWNRKELPESPGSQIGMIRGAFTSSDFGALAFTASSSPMEAIRIGGGDPDGSVSVDAIIRRVVVRAREQKLS